MSCFTRDGVDEDSGILLPILIRKRQEILSKWERGRTIRTGLRCGCLVDLGRGTFTCSTDREGTYSITYDERAAEIWTVLGDLEHLMMQKSSFHRATWI